MHADPSPTSHAAQTGFVRTPGPGNASPGTGQAAGAPAAAPLSDPFVTAPGATSFVTGAYQSSGDAMIDRMLQLERALKQFAPPF